MKEMKSVSLMIFDLERKFVELVRAKFKVETDIIDNDDELRLVVRSLFNNEIVHSHKKDLLPLYEAITNRRQNEALK